MSSQPESPKEPEAAKNEQIESISTAPPSNEEPTKVDEYKARMTFIEDVLIDICCGKQLIAMVRFDGQRASVLNRQIAQFGLQALQFCDDKNPDLRAQILEKVAERYVPLGRDDIPIEEARLRASRTLEDMQCLANGESIKALCARGGFINPGIINQRVAIVATQVLTAIKDFGVDKDAWRYAVAELLSGNAYPISFFDELGENTTKRRFSNAGNTRGVAGKRGGWGHSTGGNANWENTHAKSAAWNNDGVGDAPAENW
ncbi:hypothetical protein LTR84_012960 [Exophiala bonariae]|uniref:Uncharacterized protein n=1 Tax=Exophiala bonariae TaxID=1690606 RepID=A0AAV9NHY3_9EURO|nr:hypothetical protein LTR84_012960 [Exophiala bonariae]